MLFEGVKLMLVGMTTVLLFLSFMILLLLLVSKLTSKITHREFEQLELTKRQRQKEYEQKKTPPPVEDDEEHLAVIAAAISAFEAEKSIA